MLCKQGCWLNLERHAGNRKNNSIALQSRQSHLDLPHDLFHMPTLALQYTPTEVFYWKGDSKTKISPDLSPATYWESCRYPAFFPGCTPEWKEFRQAGCADQRLSADLRAATRTTGLRRFDRTSRTVYDYIRHKYSASQLRVVIRCFLLSLKIGAHVHRDRQSASRATPLENFPWSAKKSVADSTRRNQTEVTGRYDSSARCAERLSSRAS